MYPEVLWVKSGARWGGGFFPSFFKGKYIVRENCIVSRWEGIWTLLFYCKQCIKTCYGYKGNSVLCFFKGTLLSRNVQGNLVDVTGGGGGGDLTVTVILYPTKGYLVTVNR